MPIPDSIQQLVDNFAANRAEYHKGHYNETQTRVDYVNPLFAALGWDMDNQSGLSELHRDVVHEDKIKIGGQSKAPDYSFRTGGERKFFVETKKPSVNLFLEGAPAFQVRRYAWTVKMPLSILTNFEECAVYDTRVRPDQKDAAKTARLEYFKFTEYAEKWDELTARFSRDAVLSGAFDRYAAEAQGKRISVPVDQAFLAEISGWREKLARNIVANNPDLGPRELNYAVQMIIDRLIFLRISEDRGAEPDFLLRPLMNRGGPVYPRLLDIFRRADARYNSGLFHFEPDPKREGPDDITPRLTIDDRPLREIIASVYYPESPFEFSVFPADILGQVYEQFLGKVIRVSGKTAEVEEKPEVKKAGGVYYTPTYIVDYIVKNTVGKLVEGRTPAQVSKLTILDPACGSGSFLIGAYQFLLDWHLRYYLDHDRAKHAKGKNSTIYLFKKDPALGEIWRLTTAEKKRILLANIYGVDIDTQAVEVSKLSLLLKVLEGESAELIDNSLKLFKERALPDLEHNIKCGNSLIGPDFYTDKDMALFDLDAQLKINTFDWTLGFPQVMKSGGFDAVIGNPPYGADYTTADKKYFQSNYTYKKGKPETYIFFVEQGYKLLKSMGTLGYIVPNAWLTNYYGVQLREFILKHTTVENLVDLEPTKVFTQAVVDTAICIFTKDTVQSQDKVCQIWAGTKDHQIIHRFDMPQSLWESDEEFIINVHANPNEVKLLDKIEASTNFLSDLVEYSQGVIPYKTEADGKANLYISTEHTGNGWLPLIQNASQVRRYESDAPHAFIHYGPWLWCEREPRFFSQQKILFHRVRKKLPRQLVGSLDKNGIINRHSLSNLILREGVPPENLFAVLGLFNSKLANWWFIKKFGLLMEVGGFKVGRMPLPMEWDKGKGALVVLVERMLKLHTDKAAARLATEKNMLQMQIEAADAQIDKLVYELYGLTEDEIAVVEGTS